MHKTALHAISPGNQYESVIISRGMRSGTVPHVLAVGLGAACEVAKEELEVNLLVRNRCISRIRMFPLFLHSVLLAVIIPDHLM